MVKGIVTNDSDQPSSVQLVVTAPNSSGVQFARRITVPAKTAFETSWPVWIPAKEAGNLDFNFLAFQGGEDNGIIRRRENEQVLSNFSAIVGEGRVGFSAWLSSPGTSTHEMDTIMHFLRMMRYTAHNNQAVVTVLPREIGGQPQALDALDQLAVSSSELAQYPEVCESIRLWLQRGGRLLLCLDMTGPDAAELLLGDALPLTLVGETSSDTIKLEINADYRKDSYPDREVIREYDEPIRYLRVVADAGEPVWTIDGWPAAIRVRFGRGVAIVTTVSPEVFYKPRERRTDREPADEAIGSMRRMQDSLFGLTQNELLKKDDITAQAAAQIGYSIPSRSFAGLMTLGFPVLLLVTGLWLLRRNHGERIVWLLPGLALAISLPAVAMGLAARGVAPPTVIQTQMVHAVSGQRQLVSDGYATTYSPDPVELQVRGTESAIICPNDDVANNDLRRLLWTGFRENEWLNFDQPAGVNSLKLQTVRRMSEPLDVRATFDRNGITGKLVLSDLTDPRDAILVGLVPDMMAVKIATDGTFSAGPNDVLAPGEFFSDSLVNDVQRQHALVYASVLNNQGRIDAFPEQPSLLYWATADQSTMTIGGDETRRQESLLVVQPLRFEAPPLDETITIPPSMLSYRAIADDAGSFTAVFNNSERSWDPVGREAAGTARLEIQIPQACLPFVAEQADVTLQIRAGSRKVKVLAGSAEGLEQVASLNSPVGRVQIVIPAEPLRHAAKLGRIWLQLEIGAIESSSSTEAAMETGEQDDAWVVDRMMLTLKGKRVAEAQ